MKIVCIGSGNVATHMAGEFKKKGHDLIQVWSRNSAHAEVLASSLASMAMTDLAEIDLNADLYLIAIKDNAISSVVRALGDVNGLVVHTSGATSIAELDRFSSHGVLYPLQTFSKAKAVDFKDIPLCIEATDADSLDKLRTIAAELSKLVYEVDSDKREILHLSAVFACNFVNHMYNLGAQVLRSHDLDFEMLRPLIMETAMKVQTEMPVNVQTGPAVRDDEQTILKHLELLESSPHLKEIYQTLSESIKKSN
ncbi:Rossmann-like and DUF2520 domain-containing protein [Pedobacter psychroterrae]|uniref:DUF2520 domain-containing protein n=1 Tax=Pedobacter psychroterrae TaxID=2530453 RepID=A0A4R0NMR3_9SPHI|nr:Rossmann-like and DUF2520 domain-containing protein [Pedobacter psychroterrae]TCD00903.1 DUF2520 domain-containing protein [Pedobacter psychroterrae]